MKPKIILGGSAFIIAAIFIASMNFTKAKTVQRPPVDAPKGYTEAYAKQLQAAGFTNNEYVVYMQVKEHRDFWKNTFGLTFIGDAEIQKFLRDNDFIMGETSRYLEVVPPAAFASMNKTLDRIKSKYAPFVKYGKIDNDFMITFGGGETGWLSIGGGDNVIRRTVTYDIPSGNYITDLVDGTTKTERIDKGKPTITYDTLPMNSEVWIIAAKAKFNTDGMQLEGRILRNPPNDPIALVKVKGGYVELANW